MGCTDLAHSVRHTRFLPGACGAVAVLTIGLLAGLVGWPDLPVVAALALFAPVWELMVTRGFGRGRPGLPLVVAGAAVAAMLAVSGQAGEAGGPFGRWLQQLPLSGVSSLSADHALILLGVLLVQLSTGNVVVRLFLAVTGTVTAARQGTAQDPQLRLKGGRLLGPMERVFILGLGLAGQLTAASIVVAAKGLLRFPELSSQSEQERVHRLTEYFLVGSFVSWLVALGGLALAALTLTGQAGWWPG